MNEINQSKLFFIIAPDRSGTSILQELMNTFSGFCNREESRIVPGGPSCWDFVARSNDFSYIENYIQKNWTKEFFIEKSPPSISCMPQISKKFPNANFIFLKRNPLKIFLSQMNLYIGVSDMGTRQEDLGDILFNKDSFINSFERSMAQRLLKMINNQIKYKTLFKNRIELKYEDITDSLENQLKLIENKFGIKANYKKASDQIKKPSYSSNFRYGLKEINDKLACDIISLSERLWGYQ